MGFKDAIDNIKQKRDYEAEIAELKAKLKATEADNKKLQNKIDILEKSANAITSSNTALKQPYELQKIIENFKKELAKLPPVTGKRAQEKYNTLFVIVDYFCIPVLKELGMEELSNKMKEISVMIKEAGIMSLCATAMHDRLNGKLTGDVSEFVKDKSKYFIGCDEEKHRTMNVLEQDLVTVEYCQRFKDLVQKKYGTLYLKHLLPDYDKKDAKDWLEMIITLGAAAYDFMVAMSGNSFYAHTLNANKKDEFNPDNPMKNTHAAKNAYKMLYDIAQQFGLDFSKMDVNVDRYEICKPEHPEYQIPNNVLEKGRD